MKTRIKTSSQNVLLALSALFFLFACTAFFFLHKAINSKNRLAEENQVKLQAEDFRRSNMKSLDSLLVSTSSDRASLETHFATEDDIVKFLDSIEQTGTLVNVKVEVSSVDVPKENGGIEVQVTTDGTFEATYKFLTLLENFPYEIEVYSFNTEKYGNTPENPNAWKASFRIKLLSFVK